MSPTSHSFLWLDLETTGLSPYDGEIAEWALVLADDGPGGTFQPVHAFGSVVHVDQAAWDKADTWVRKTHGGSGLIAECLDHNAPKLAEVEAFLLEMVADLSSKEVGLFTLAGASPHFDLAWLRVHMPKFSRRLAHRVFDVSTLRRALQDYGPPDAAKPLFDTVPAHRAMADVEWSLATARAVLRTTGWPGVAK